MLRRKIPAASLKREGPSKWTATINRSFNRPSFVPMSQKGFRNRSSNYVNIVRVLSKTYIPEMVQCWVSYVSKFQIIRDDQLLVLTLAIEGDYFFKIPTVEQRKLNDMINCSGTRRSHQRWLKTSVPKKYQRRYVLCFTFGLDAIKNSGVSRRNRCRL